MEMLYTAVATATDGREGQVKSSDGVLELQVRLAKALGGSTEGSTERIKTGPTSVTAAVGIGKISEDRFGLAVTLTANIPGVTTEGAKALIEKAHLVCPYSNATRGNIEVRLEVTTIER